ncbi:MAG: mannose-6-phosphate isomerase class I [Granulosicoccus sp.]|jgi:mannose-6-phosphate isomerase class I
MEVASLAVIKKELKTLEPQESLDLCLRLGRFKKENKELLSYLLFDSKDEDRYIEMACEDVDEILSSINTTGFYLAKKTIRKAHRSINKHIRFSPQKETEVEVRLYFCESLRNLDIKLKGSRVLMNLYGNEILRIDKAISTLHPDLQFDFESRLEEAKSFL